MFEYTVEAPAKVNLYLKITERLPNGYHHLDSVMQTLGLHDTVHLSLAGRVPASLPASPTGYAGAAFRRRFRGGIDAPFEALPRHVTVDYFERTIPEAETGEVSRNLAVRALAAVLTGDEALGRPVKAMLREPAFADHVHIRLALDKRIPVGAGLGGGSSDAAAIFRWAADPRRYVGAGESLEASDDPTALPEVYHREAAGLGADIPFLLYGGTARCRGIGDRVEPFAFEPPTWHYLLVRPPVAISTGEAYAKIDAWREATGAETVSSVGRDSARGFMDALRREDPDGMAAAGGNDFLAVEAEDSILRRIRGHLRATHPCLTDLSGSGATVFAAYRTRDEAEAARRRILAVPGWPDLWVQLTVGRPVAYNRCIM